MVARRHFLASLLAAGAAPRLGWAAAGDPSFLAAARDPDGGFALYGLTLAGAAVFRVALPSRGHAGAGHPTQALAVAFARRPGAWALVVDCLTGAVRARLTPPAGMQFNGHGVFLERGAVLATSEQRAKGSAGIVGLWDSRDWRRLGEIPTGGIGPHDLRLLPDGRSLVVANGGIATDPLDRSKLNLADMQPSLAYVSSDGGPAGIVALDPDLHQASIRHLAVRADGCVAFAMQWEGEAGRVVPLLGLHRRGQPVVLGPALERMRGYAGSIAWDGQGERLVLTSPKGGMAMVHAADGRALDSFARADICGAAPMPVGHLTSDGQGALIALETTGPRLLARHECAWDNHIVALWQDRLA